MKRYRRLIILIVLFVLIIVGLIFGVKAIFFNEKSDDKNVYVLKDVDYRSIDELDLDLYSRSYLLIRLNDYKALYGKKYDSPIYPASLTKVVAMDTLLSLFSDLSDTSSLTQEQYNNLISENASLAGLVPYREYRLIDLLYYLVLPSGADAAVAIENYFESKGLNLVDEMNKRCNDLGLKDSHFTNPTGLHDDDMYTTLKDLSLIYIDCLKFKEGKDVLKTAYKGEYYLYSTLYPLVNRGDEVIVYGGKTGYTDEAHQNIIVFYEAYNRSYILLLAGAFGDEGAGAHYHYKDVNTIFEYLYN